MDRFLFQFLGFETLSSLRVYRLYKLVKVHIERKVVKCLNFYVLTTCLKFVYIMYVYLKHVWFFTKNYSKVTHFVYEVAAVACVENLIWKQ